MFYRQGDLAYIKTKQVTGLKGGISQGIIFNGGSGGHNHEFKGGTFYSQEKENTIGYLKAKDTILYHPEHGKGKGMKKGKIADGFYEVRRQVEHTHEGLKQVID